MKRNSTLLFIADGCKGVNEITDIDEMLDPNGKYGIELKKIFNHVSFSPRKDLIDKILMKAL